MFVFVTMDRRKLKIIMYMDDEFGEDNFKVSMNEGNWKFDEIMY